MTKETSESSVRLSAAAAKRIGEIAAGKRAPAVLRVAVHGGGCSGFQYDFSLEASQKDDDIAVARDGAVLLVDSVSLPYLAGAEVDYVDDLIGAAFRVHNPNATASCGCGTSFSV